MKVSRNKRLKGFFTKNFWKKGSMTVEASFLVPMAVFVCGLLILYCFYEHNRVWYTAAAYEAALVGTKKTEQGEDREQLARVRAEERLEIQPFPGSVPEVQVSVEEKESRVSYRTDGVTGFLRDFPYEVEADVKECDPISRVRTAWIARMLLKGSS